MSVLPWAVAAWLFGIGIVGIVRSRDMIHLVGCLSVSQGSSYVLLLALGYKWGSVAPVFYDHPPGTPAVDPVVQALVLTDIVVGATITALLLAMTIQIHKRTGTIDPQALKPLHRTGDPR